MKEGWGVGGLRKREGGAISIKWHGSIRSVPSPIKQKDKSGTKQYCYSPIFRAKIFRIITEKPTLDADLDELLPVLTVLSAEHDLLMKKLEIVAWD